MEVSSASGPVFHKSASSSRFLQRLTWLSRRRPWKCHRHWILKITHEDCRDGQHERRQELLCIVIDLCIREGNTRTEQSNPCWPLDLHHETTHGKDHRQQVHVIGSRIFLRCSRSSLTCFVSVMISRLINTVACLSRLTWLLCQVFGDPKWSLTSWRTIRSKNSKSGIAIR